MRKAILLFFLIITAFSFTTSKKKILKQSIKTIIIDPGHGGLDPGARGLFSTEANVSLGVSLKLGNMIEQEFPDIKVVYTRTTDVLPGNKPNKDAALKYRADLANSSNGDLFIAIHCNSAGRAPGGWYAKRISGYTTGVRKVKVRKKWVTKTVKVPVYETYWVENVAKGTETYVWAVGKNNAKINSVSKSSNEYSGEIDSTSSIDLPDPKDPVDKARMLIYAQNFFRKSLTLADFIEQQFEATGRITRGVKQRNDKGIWVLQATGMPSVLVEIGFISNKEEEQYINSDKGQEDIVNNIMSALRAYKQKLEQKQSFNE
jgi:N-acetylmuramoyl-L-alanine amidase